MTVSVLFPLVRFVPKQFLTPRDKHLNEKDLSVSRSTARFRWKARVCSWRTGRLHRIVLTLSTLHRPSDTRNDHWHRGNAEWLRPARFTTTDFTIHSIHFAEPGDASERTTWFWPATEMKAWHSSVVFNNNYFRNHVFEDHTASLCNQKNHWTQHRGGTGEFLAAVDGHKIMVEIIFWRTRTTPLFFS